MQQRKLTFENSGAIWEVIENFSHIATEIHKLYEAVLERSKTKFEVLTPQFFSELSERLGPNALILLARRKNEAIAFGLLILGGSKANLLYVGLDYSCRDETASYYNIFYRAIEVAEARGCNEISVGQTTYESKAALGATFFQLKLGLAPLTPLARLLISRFTPLLFPVTETPDRRVFKNASAKDASPTPNLPNVSD
jgi:hypothetical protein